MSEVSGVDKECWNCGAVMADFVACELKCFNCGFIRDCSDP